MTAVRDIVEHDGQKWMIVNEQDAWMGGGIERWALSLVGDDGEPINIGVGIWIEKGQLS